MLSPSHQRSLYTLATTMLISVAKIFNMPYLIDFLKMNMSLSNMDPYISITDDLYIYVKPAAELKEYGTGYDQSSALSSLSALRIRECEAGQALVYVILRGLSGKTELNMEILVKELCETFVPDDTFLLGPESVLDLGSVKRSTKNSLSFDEDVSASALTEDDLALEVAGHVASASVTTSPLSYSMMASQCEALGFGTRMKGSNWLVQDTGMGSMLTFSNNTKTLRAEDIGEVHRWDDFPREPWQVLRLPPASPFDNFLMAAGC